MLICENYEGKTGLKLKYDNCWIDKISDMTRVLVYIFLTRYLYIYTFPLMAFFYRSEQETKEREGGL